MMCLQKSACKQVQASVFAQKKKHEQSSCFLFCGAVYAKQIVLTHLVRCTDTACLICLLCPLRTISANAVRLQLSLLAVTETCSEQSERNSGTGVLARRVERQSDGVRVAQKCAVRCIARKPRCSHKRKNTNKVRAFFFVVRSPRLELGRCNHTPLKRTRLPIPP